MRAGIVVCLAATMGCAHAAAPAPTAVGTVKTRAPLDVPLFPDRTDQCGPSALAGVLRFWKKEATPADLKSDIYRAALKGSLPMDLLLAARARGMNAEILDGDFSDLKKELDAGHPVIAFVNRGFEILPIGHYLVVTGVDEGRHGIYANSGVRKNVFIPDRIFIKQWERTDRWALLITPFTL